MRVCRGSGENKHVFCRQIGKETLLDRLDLTTEGVEGLRVSFDGRAIAKLVDEERDGLTERGLVTGINAS